MNFQFESLSEFAWMGGHGPYVWACYGVMAVVVVWLLVRPVLQRRRTLAEIARQQRLAQPVNTGVRS
jgi:heme exporter protein D